MAKTQSIQVKLTLALIVSTVLVVVIATTMLYRTSYAIIKDLVFSDVRNTAFRYGNQVAIDLESMLATARSLASAFKNYDDIPIESRRNFFNILLKNTLEANSRFYAVWTTWERDKLDGLDAQNISVNGSNEVGRFVSTWYRDGTNFVLADVPEEELETADYYLLAKEADQEFIMEPYYYSYTGSEDDEVFETSIIVPIWIQGEFIAEIGIDIALQDFDTLLNNITPYQEGYAMLLSGEGMYVSHPKKESIGQYFRDQSEENKSIAIASNMDEKIEQGDEVVFYKTSRSTGLQSYFHYVPLKIGSSNHFWSMGIVVPMNVINTMTNGILFTFIPVMLGLAIILSSLVFILSGYFLRPLKALTLRLEDLATGQGDLRIRLGHPSNDEVGLVSKTLDTFLDSLAQMVSDIKTASKEAGETGSQLLHAASDGAASLEEIRINVESMQRKYEILDKEITNVVQVSELVGSFFHGLAGQISDQSQQLTQAGSRVNAVTRSIKDGATEATARLQDVRKLQETALKGEAAMKRSMESISKINNSAKIVSSMLQMINTIAAQTNLLAMNAAIEAAHAGEFGRGFAVVADEIRSLAEDAAKNSKSISLSIKEIFGLITEGEAHASLSGSLFKSMVTEVDRIAQSMESINGGMLELVKEGGLVEENLHGLLINSKELQTTGVQAQEQVTHIGTLVSSIKDYSQDNKVGMDEVTMGIKGIWEAVQIIHSSSDNNAEKVSMIQTLTNKFKT